MKHILALAAACASVALITAEGDTPAPASPVASPVARADASPVARASIRPAPAAGAAARRDAAPEIGPIPEPAAWAMLLVGFGLIGAGARRCKRVIS